MSLLKFTYLAIKKYTVPLAAVLKTCTPHWTVYKDGQYIRSVKCFILIETGSDCLSM